MSGTGQSRKFGLDLMRAIAISIVLACHFSNYLHAIGIYGVDIFFALSGFLIGGILLKTIQKTEQFDFENLQEFLKRRWYRTLPNYYLFLLITFLYTCVNKEFPPHFILYPFFLQNFAWRPDEWFLISWSLAVEEWFYLSVSLSIFAFSYIRSNRTQIILFTFAIFIFLPIIFRLLLLKKISDPNGTVILRLDAIMYGVVMAYIKSRFPQFWNRKLLFAGGFAVLFIGSFLPIPMDSDLHHAIALSLIPMSFACLLPAFDALKCPYPHLSNAIEKISIWSYSIYLSHMLLYDFLKMPFHYDELSTIGKAGFKLFSVAVIVFISALNYRYFEKPMTDLRDRRKSPAGEISEPQKRTA